MNPDIAQARKVADAMVPVANKELERMGIKLVATYPFSGQMLFCRKPVASLADLKGLKVRTGGPSLADLMKALGAQPVSMAFGEVYTALERGTVDCAITGSGSGNGVKWPEVTTHLYTLPLAWSTAGYFVNLAWWNKLEPAIRTQFEKTFSEVQEAQWKLGAEATDDGIGCNVGRAADCKLHTLFKKPMVESRPEAGVKTALARHLSDEVLPGWVKRCGDRCAATYNDVIAPITGVKYSK
jgi:TRAP-type C4-dicarboxylate transport system substrate-binding protein